MKRPVKTTVKKLATLFFGALLCGSAYAASNPALIPAVATIAALRALGNAASQYPTVQVNGYYTAGDGGGGIFIWSAASTATVEPCVTFQATGVTTGRFIRQLNSGAPITTTGCGVKADSSTDNLTNLQAAVTAASTYGRELFCPSNTGTIKFSSTVNVPNGVIIRGENNTTTPLGQTGVSASCYFYFTGTAIGAVFANSATPASSCPQVQGPSFYNFSIDFADQNTGYGIKLNDPASAGYVDVCSGGSPGQPVLQNGHIENIIFHCSQRGTSGISLAKVFNYTIRDNTSAFCDYPWQFDGSDNIDFQHNNITQATTADLKLVGHGTFGNMFYAHNNTFNSVYINAPYFIDSTYGQMILDSNYFESQNAGGTAAIYLHGGLDNTIINNGMYIVPALMTYWLKVDNNFETLFIQNNWDGGGNAPANFNSGAGVQFVHSSGALAAIRGSGNPDSNAGIPYFTNDAVTGGGYQSVATPPSAAGALLASVSPTYPIPPSGTYGASVYAKTGCFVVPALAGTASEFKFAVRPVVSDTIDVWVYAYADSGTTQLVAISTDNGVGYSTQALTTTATWYKIINNTAVVNPVLAIKNSDLAHGSVTVNVCAITYAKH